MSAAAMVGHMLLERLSWHNQPRVPEPDLVMEDAAQVEAFDAGGQAVLAPLYFFHAVAAMPAIGAGGRVLDLACGSGQQLAQLAQLNPDAQFTGIDLSATMLDAARRHLQANGLSDTTLIRADITRLDGIADASVDTVISTLGLHHLPDAHALQQTLREVARVLKPQGGLYISDFARLRRRASQHYFAHDRAREQGERFTLDYWHSLRAAFASAELRAALAQVAPPASVYATALAPFMMVFRRAAATTAEASAVPATRAALARTRFAAFSPGQQRDVRALTAWFAPSGLRLPVAL